MHFLYPAFLWGLLAVALPVLIHLFNFRRTKRVFFTNVRFLRQIETTTSSFRRLKQWLILAARILAIVCLVLAFAQPFIPAANQAGIRMSGTSGFYLDNSLSMQNLSDNRKLLDIAVGKVEELLSVFPNAPSLQLTTNDFGAEEHAMQGAKQLRDRLPSVDFSHTPRTLESVLRRQLQLAGPQGDKQFFWFSDFQKSTAGDLSKVRPDSNTRVFLLPVQPDMTQNVYVDTLWLATPFIREMQSNAVRVRLRNAGEKAVENLSVKLLLDDAQVASQIVTIPARNYVETTFSFTVRGKGFRKGRVTFEDSPVVFDNDYYFVLNAAPTIRVVHIFGEKTGNYVENVFSNDSLFHRSSFPAGNVDVGLIAAANLVVLEGLPSVDGSLRAELLRFVQKGGSLLVIPGVRPDVFWLQGVGISGAAAVAGDPSVPSSLAEPTRENPFFADIFDQTRQKERMAMPSATQVWSWRVAGDKLLSFPSGEPFLTSSRAGTGKIYLLGAPLDSRFGDFSQHALFLPVMYKIAALSVRQAPIAYPFSAGSLSVDVSDAPPNAVFRLKKGPLEMIPVQHLNGTQLVMEIPRASELNAGQVFEAGYYELTLNGKAVQLLALNHDGSESDLAYYTSDELKAAFAGQKNIQVFENQQKADFVSAYREQHLGSSLWKYFLIAALVFLLIEIALIRLMKA
ncbi:BatA domain-containing protein [Siphonobacter aquaeclarae]|uniref:N-terminal double-transmembrane domain-containing protein n=1 Tax=Siphonobacter aquaeclarae TaxID=563176 RepID=A0A1G9WDH7_9BACT|nr:BatA domain-containing protein [Siphonobacter aquaeclarae]SDM82236.1 N-terminal double-transmembrane domain-containing protein [Siphonobacter aquaeclarae]